MESIIQTADHRVWREENSLVVEFKEPKTVISTSQFNGGIKTNIQAIFNHQIPAIEHIHELPGGSIPAYLAYTANKLGLEPKTSVGLLTAASMKNMAWDRLSHKALAVEAYITAGVDVNGGRAGDPAAYYEEAANFYTLGGTINTLLLIQAKLSPGALVKSLITATEAKTAALQELVTPSRYSRGLATGSGTDGIIVVSNPEASLTLTDAGLHSKLGELIGQAVKSTTKKALALETGLSARRQYNVLERLKRFGLDQIFFKARFAACYPNKTTAFPYENMLSNLAGDGKWVTLTSILVHLQDQIDWELITYEDALVITKQILASLLDQNCNYAKGIPILYYLVDAINKTICRNIDKNEEELS